MDIPNLASDTTPSAPVKTSNTITNQALFSLPVVIFVIVIAIVTGFGLSRLFPKSSTSLSINSKSNSSAPVSTDNITSGDQLVAGKLYGSTDPGFTDTAQGTIEKGSINGVGTHILNREGGATQRASLTSSTVDLDLFVGKKVEVNGQTNTSNKTGWLLDVGSIKIIQ